MIKNSETVRGQLIKVDLSCRFDKDVLFISAQSPLGPHAAWSVLSRAVLPRFPCASWESSRLVWTVCQPPFPSPRIDMSQYMTQGFPQFFMVFSLLKIGWA